MSKVEAYLTSGKSKVTYPFLRTYFLGTGLELKELDKSLRPNESINYMTACKLNDQKVLVVVTNLRLHIISKGLIVKRYQNALDLGKINGVSRGREFFMGVVDVDFGFDNYHFTDFWWSDTERFHETLEQSIHDYQLYLHSGGRPYREVAQAPKRYVAPKPQKEQSVSPKEVLPLDETGFEVGIGVLIERYGREWVLAHYPNRLAFFEKQQREFQALNELRARETNEEYEARVTSSGRAISGVSNPQAEPPREKSFDEKLKSLYARAEREREIESLKSQQATIHEERVLTQARIEVLEEYRAEHGYLSREHEQILEHSYHRREELAEVARDLRLKLSQL